MGKMKTKNKAEAAPAIGQHNNAQPKELHWVSLRDSNGRASSLCLNCRGINPGHFVITGNLEHGATVRCDTWADAVKLADHVTGGNYFEMLAALRQIEAILTQPVQFTGIRNGASCDVLRCDAKSAVESARAAIAKAERGQA